MVSCLSSFFPRLFVLPSFLISNVIRTHCPLFPYFCQPLQGYLLHFITSSHRLSSPKNHSYLGLFFGFFFCKEYPRHTPPCSLKQERVSALLMRVAWNPLRQQHNEVRFLSHWYVFYRPRKAQACLPLHYDDPMLSYYMFTSTSSCSKYQSVPECVPFNSCFRCVWAVNS